MNAEIIAVGSELLLGQIVNTNAQYLSKELADLGVDVYFHTVVGDNEKRLRSVVREAQQRADIIIFTGGLGPTKDDLTKETIASMLGKKLAFDEEAMSHIVNYYKKTKREMSENNKKQALVIEGSKVLRNDNGMAPGMVINSGKVAYYLFPGPPHELKPMFENYAKPGLLDLLDIKEHIESRVLRFFGIGESQLETDIIDLIENQTNPTIAPLAGDAEVTLRLTAKHHSKEAIKKLLDELEQKIQLRVGQFFYGYDDDTLVSRLFQNLIESNSTIAVAESLTGGLFSEQLTSNAGASSVIKGGIVCYSNEIKEHVLGVQKETLVNYGAVSRECALELADNVREKFNSNIGISFTGVAGPSMAEGKDVGTVYIGISKEGLDTRVYDISLAGNRKTIRNRAVKFGCLYLLKMLKK